ncbi:MAG: hypothetical protein A2X19_06440 [Bacteroidetes bacterium GWE2_39_28]|nr:MAG: hypothetical protein A2X19_06440 [Bacteroidetes bacterium GWE2_39_28]OFY13788.1 MAG: hypothetical protein A2X16_00320 [Bacteroidetes bacterium GWF2_39_10]OFZ09155.1 MAG: hypothetical protein A2322_05175 [Bacteroidetes bacterium RIFOXYB2_FULL_39_7]OFZ10196.1 MAG: hypothetical protein A2465_01010 [Bacteroidetes bacterium RIFOXYC2_FULL_39_11]HCT94783.1 DUF1460 domain-containing protein [Rikenellaceae bacterium]
MKRLAIILFFVFFTHIVNSQNQSQKTDKDKEIFERYILHIGDASEISMGDLVTKSALFFLETPYVGHTLEKEPEQLIINLRELDCTTLVETVLALSKTVKEGDPTFEKFGKNLQLIRYRNGVINDYSDRLHYTTDWLYENQKKGLIWNITKESGGIEHNVNLYVMSTNHEKYKQLKGKPGLTEKIRIIEQEATGRKNFRIPASEIEKNRASFQNGDMVCFVTKMGGIDISHVAFIYFQGNKLTFIHASSAEMKVVIEKETLMNYSLKSKNGNGIMVARPL